MKKILPFFCLLAFSANLSAQEKIKLLPLKIESLKLSDADKNDLLDVLVKKIKKYPNYEILETPSNYPSDIAFDLGCADLDNECISKMGEKSGAKQVIYSEANTTDTGFSVKIALIDAATGQTLNSVEGEEANRAKVPEFFAKAAEKIFGPEPVPVPVKSQISIKTDPPGAEIYIGTDFYGLSPAIIRLLPGNYILKVNKIGYKETMEELKVKEGADVQKDLKLDATPPPPQGEPAPSKPKESDEKVEEETRFYEAWWFWTAVGVVAAGAGVGTYFLLKGESSTSTGGIVISPDQYFSDKDVTLMKK
ncbi:MAG: PEGA domain-containing protein [Deltaproteobacteria bacterium]|nr:PEGA domain-containing protein [Deltaproteobacteria bacterium]